jgi:fermentation-respiration switch protein FrsA (DUF1100 family)
MLFKAAGEPKELWITPDAHHVGARDTDPETYFERVDRFFRQALAFSPAEAGVALRPTA